ncbi:hypothetical protein B0A52_06885 [Exophiala mesophila]|uniref:Microbial-type PARG catalytic domain-containing protein n=1 Tax=Exophiala mesophila TaxID=212818 RepID=A0A438N0S5_EXOME|nr:hypothetical protein B0A52_06885 [Exophiala mesophila]
MNKTARASLAKETINVQIPNILSSNARARKGVSQARQILGTIDLPKLPAKTMKHEQQKSLQITLRHVDTLEAAHGLLQEKGKSRIAVLNMASPLQAGGGVLRGARAQEESLCLRSTLYPSLRQEWYRHKPDAIIYTPDVLVFKSTGHMRDMLKPEEQFYVDVISAAAPRHPEVEVSNDGVQNYSDPKDEEMMALKIKYIMRTAAKMSATHVVLGALGCGAYHNPIKKVASIMRRVLLGTPRSKGPEEDWEAAGIKEVVFAILDETREQTVWNGFVEEFRGHDGVVIEDPPQSSVLDQPGSST